jgi:hypothetical protein
MIPDDAIQNELIIISHHIEDIEEGLKARDMIYVQRGIGDIKESIQRLAEMLKPREKTEIERIADTIDG